MARSTPSRSVPSGSVPSRSVPTSSEPSGSAPSEPGRSGVIRRGARTPAAGEVRVVVAAIGITALGTQVGGTVDAVGPDSVGFARGDRVAFRADRPDIAARTVVHERDLIGIPADVSLDAAAVLFPCALLARTVVRQVHTIGSGDSVAVLDRSVLAPFVRGWAEHLGARLVGRDDADTVITPADLRRARDWRSGHGFAQQAAADVFAAIRSGAFDAIPLGTLEQARNGSRAPVLLHPGDMGLAA